jgi:hypothetical protein
VENLIAVVVKTEKFIRMCQRDPLEFVNNMPGLYRVALQKITSGRDIVKEVFDGDACAVWQCFRTLVNDFRTLDLYHCAEFIFYAMGFELYLRDRSNRCHSFPTETHRSDCKEILRFSDFARRMAFEAQSCIRNAHPTAIVDDLDERFACIFDDQLYTVSAGIYRIFDQFFDSRGRSLYDLAGCNLVGDSVWEQLNDIRHILRSYEKNGSRCTEFDGFET